MNTPTASIHPIEAKRAVIYLRVSTAAQAKTSRDDEGFSIAAQREACMRKAESLGADVIDEYIDAGESARSADRPNLIAMLNRLKEERDIDLVIVHKVDRLARNRSDDVEINMVIRTAGAQLVSVSENIDETPSGMLLHGIMSSIAEFYSQNLATEIVKGMSQKAKQGGQPGRAPVGYLNVREFNNGHEIRTVAPDPERAPHITWAFEAYATGDYSLNQLTDALLDRGLTTKATAKFPSRPLVVRHVHNMLRNRFYVGLVKWRDVEYPGQHEPIVSVEMFARVQALLQSRGAASEKTRTHPHYLKGSIFCGRCGGRLCFTRSKGKGGSYDYFFCLNRHQQRKNCDLPFLPVALVEEAVASHYGTIEPSERTARKLAGALTKATQARTSGADSEARRQRKRITDLETTRRKLLQAHLAGAVPVDLLKEEQDRIARELANAGAALAATEIDWEALQTKIDAALGFTTRLEDAYRHADGKTRRHLNQTIFEELRIDRGGITYARLSDPLAQLFAEDLLDDLRQESEHPGPVEQDRGVNVHHLVELTTWLSQHRVLDLTEAVADGSSTPARRDRRVRQKQRRLAAAQSAELVAAYVAGAEPSELAAQYGVHAATVRAIVDRQGLRRARRKELTESEVDAIVAQFSTGTSMRSLARDFEVSPTTIWRRLKQRGALNDHPDAPRG